MTSPHAPARNHSPAGTLERPLRRGRVGGSGRAKTRRPASRTHNRNCAFMTGMALHRPGPGRPSKGARRLIASRLPVEHANEIEQRADALGLSMSEFVAHAMAEYLRSTPAPEGAQALISREEVAV